MMNRIQCSSLNHFRKNILEIFKVTQYLINPVDLNPNSFSFIYGTAIK